MQNKVVARFADGSMVKGITNDFFPTKDAFHVVVDGAGVAQEIKLTKLKALFFVKTFDGNQEETGRSAVEQTGMGRKVMVTFADDEIILGYASSYSKAAVGFFVFPADAKGNNLKIFVINAATKSVRFL